MRLFTEAGGLGRILKVLDASLRDDVGNGEEAIEYGHIMARIFLSIASQTDRVVRTMISGTSEQTRKGIRRSSASLGLKILQQTPSIQARSSVLAQLLGLLSSLDKDKDPNGKRRDILLMILKSLEELSKDTDCIGSLIEAKTMSTVIPFLQYKDDDIQYIVVQFLWNMTRVNNRYSIQARREAAENDAIPVLKQLSKHHPKLSKSVFLMLTICKFPNGADVATLLEMWKHNMAQFYIDMIRNHEQFHVFSVSALTALSRWMEKNRTTPPESADNVAIYQDAVYGNPSLLIKHQKQQSGNHNKSYDLSSLLSEPNNMKQLIELFKSPVANVNFPIAVRSKNVSSILDAFKTLVESQRISDALANNKVFLDALGAWFQNDHLPQEIVNDLLKMLSKILERMTDDPSSKKKCAKMILPIIDKVYQKGKKENKFIVVHLIKKEVIPHISKYVDAADTSDLCPEMGWDGLLRVN